MRQILFSGVIGLFLSLVGTPLLIKLLASKGYGQFIRDDGPQNHHSKRGTPTMGGIAFILATLSAYGLTKLLTGSQPTFSGALVLFLFAGMGLVGFLDDYIKIVKQRSLGLRAKAKMAGQLIVGIAFAVLALNFPDARGLSPASTKLSFTQDFGWSIGPVLFVIWALFMILAMSNGVNLTDGLDGLATGASVMVFGAYTFIGVWEYQESCANLATAGPGCYEVRDPLDLAVVAAALMGACFGFLWWNTSPAKIFMGDTGSLALGGALAGLAICSRTELLLAVLGGLFVLITMSVVIQVGSFRLTGKRVFKMAPLQHHFELQGWSEVLVVVRFWIIQGMCAIVGVGIFFAGVGSSQMSPEDPGEEAPGTDPAGEDGRPGPDFTGRRTTVTGLGVSGISAARALARLGAAVTLVDGGDSEALRERAAGLEAEGITVRLGDGDTLPGGTEYLVTSPGWKPGSPVFAAAGAAGVPVWGDVELAWRLRGTPPGRPAAQWLAVTGTNGKTTTVRMLAAILAAAGLRTAAVGNIGTPLIDVVLSDEPYDVLAVELSSYQLHWAPSLRAHSAVVLNLAPDHLDWHGSMEAYAADKGRIYEGNRVACVYNTADPATERLVRRADVVEGCRAIGFTLGSPGPSEFGVVDGVLVDRAFVADRRTQAQELAEVSDITPAVPHNVANALAAAALARAYGVEPAAVRDGLRAFRPDAHRIEHVAEVGGVDYVDDSKATNTHATEASLAAYGSIVWIAGGLAKGATFDELVAASAKRLRGAVLIGADRHLIREALERHAPDVPVVDLDRTDTGAMAAAVGEATRLARPGDTVLMAPACASMDMFTNYNRRGEAFAAAVRALPGGRTADGR